MGKPVQVATRGGRLLVIDDDVEHCGLVKDYLANAGYSVDVVHDGEAGMLAAQGGQYDVVILDLMNPQYAGLHVYQRLRMALTTPILVLSSRADDVDRIIGLEMGVDDYLPKPCNLHELSCRLQAIIRRSQRQSLAADIPQVLQLASLRLDKSTRKVTLEDEPVCLTSTEFNILEILLINARKVVSRNILSESVFGRKLTPDDRNIDMHICKLRRKLYMAQDNHVWIETLRGYGYKITCSEKENVSRQYP